MIVVRVLARHDHDQFIRATGVESSDPRDRLVAAPTLQRKRLRRIHRDVARQSCRGRRSRSRRGSRRSQRACANGNRVAVLRARGEARVRVAAVRLPRAVGRAGITSRFRELVLDRPAGLAKCDFARQRRHGDGGRAVCCGRQIPSARLRHQRCPCIKHRGIGRQTHVLRVRRGEQFDLRHSTAGCGQIDSFRDETRLRKRICRDQIRSS